MFNGAVLLILWLLVLLSALAYALRPLEGAVVAPIRLAIVRAALPLGAWAVVTVEASSAAEALTGGLVLAAWIAATLAVAAAVVVRCLKDADPARYGGPVSALRHELGSRRGATRRTWRRTKAAAAAAPAWQWALACVVAILFVGVAVLAIASAPNNFDSQTYHLPRIEHWVQNASVDAYATDIHRQVDISPGTEYLLTHLRLLDGGDGAYNLVQLLAGVGAVLAASRLAAQLGAGPVAQLATVFLLAATPEVLLQASSTQVDLTAAAWAACLATVVLDEFTRPGERGSPPVPAAPVPAGDTLCLGLALGLIAVTKTTGLLAAGPLLLLWGIGRLVRDGRRRRPCMCGHEIDQCSRAVRPLSSRLRTVGASVAVLALALVVVGPFLARMQAEFGSPLGPAMLRESVGVQTADPRLIAVNGLRIAQTAFDTPVRPAADAFAGGIEAFASLIGVDVNDRDMTFGSSTFPEAAWYPDEDRAAFPLIGLAALLGAAWFLWKGPGLRRAYAAALVGASVLLCATVAWQPWINRLVLFLVVLGAPIAGILVASLAARPARRGRGGRGGRPAERRRRAVAWGLIGTFAAIAALAGILTVAYGYPRRLTGTLSVFALDEHEERFVRRLEWLPQYEEAAAAVADSGAETVGIVQGNDSWEYPWWVFLPDGTELVALQSIVPDRAPADVADVDAIVCAEDLGECATIAPDSWDFRELGTVAYAVPSETR